MYLKITKPVCVDIRRVMSVRCLTRDWFMQMLGLIVEVAFGLVLFHIEKRNRVGSLEFLKKKLPELLASYCNPGKIERIYDCLSPRCQKTTNTMIYLKVRKKEIINPCFLCYIPKCFEMCLLSTVLKINIHSFCCSCSNRRFRCWEKPSCVSFHAKRDQSPVQVDGRHRIRNAQRHRSRQ